MKKTILLSLLASTMIFAGGDIDPTDVNVTTPDTQSAEATTMSFAILGGVLKGEGDDTDWNPVYGAEFAFPCLITSAVRSQLQYTHYDEDGIKMQQLSANPHYIFNRGDTVEFGFGPHLGAAKVEIGNDDDTIFTYGVGASLRADITENFFVGAGTRYEWTTDAEFDGKKDNLNNAKVFAKIGFSF